ncbi:MAG: AAA family ATPase [Cyanobacteriota bacterium]|nr:AAA family ATPase [Cyanobacteriota bacterium]
MPPLIASLLRPEAYAHPVVSIRLIETHLSWVLLTGSTAYKIKKPLNLGFVDFSTLELRHRACLEELRLNRRLAPALYRDVVPIHGPCEHARLYGDGPVIEWAVRMQEFPEQALLSDALERGAVEPQAFALLAERLARFHAEAAVAPPGSSWGTVAQVGEPALANLTVLEACPAAAAAAAVPRLRRWSEQTLAQLAPLLERRRQAGRIRECHGDLHLGNMALLEGVITVFDALEFSPALRWIDVISDLAFLVMDLERRRRPELAARVLNRWLECSGDYAGMALWRWYVTYRALVRAKVTALRLAQQGADPASGSSGDRSALERDLRDYLQLAVERGVAPRSPTLVITHGLSGSGKTHLAADLCRRLGWIHLRSDLERKRCFGLPLDRPSPVPVPGLYDPATTRTLYEQTLPDAARAVLAAGWSLIVDATFLLREQRQCMAQVARQLGCRFVILSFPADPGQARVRIDQRRAAGDDPSDADASVLAHQQTIGQPPQLAEADRLLSAPLWDARSAGASGGSPAGPGRDRNPEPGDDADVALAALIAELAPQNQ